MIFQNDDFLCFPDLEKKLNVQFAMNYFYNLIKQSERLKIWKREVAELPLKTVFVNL